MQRERRKLSGAQAVVVAVVVLAVVWWFWQDYQSAKERGRMEGGQRACEIVNEESCVYDNRFEEWVPR